MQVVDVRHPCARYMKRLEAVPVPCFDREVLNGFGCGFGFEIESLAVCTEVSAGCGSRHTVTDAVVRPYASTARRETRPSNIISSDYTSDLSAQPTKKLAVRGAASKKPSDAPDQLLREGLERLPRPMRLQRSRAVRFDVGRGWLQRELPLLRWFLAQHPAPPVEA